MALAVDLVPASAPVDGLVALGVPVASGPDGPFPVPGLPAAACGLAVPGALDPAWCAGQGFSGKVGQVLALRSSDRPSLVLVGVGSGERGEAERWRRAAAGFVRSVSGSGAAAFVLPTPDPAAGAGEGGDGDGAAVAAAAAAAVAEGASLASYRFDRFKSQPRAGGVSRLAVALQAQPDVARIVAGGLHRGARIAEAVWLARDLANSPPSFLTPTVLVDEIRSRLGQEPALRLEVWDGARLAEEGLGGLIGVARGSAEPPKLVRIDYEPAHPAELEGKLPHLALVGKGITFDSGGLSLKSADAMTNQKTDMSGAAAVVAALSACADLGIRIRVTGYVPIAENMPGGHAIKPGDVVTIRNGMTIEVLNTDAEGRLILADALALAAETEVDGIVDLATLTGAATVALGSLVAALYANDDELMARVRRAAEAAGEQVWPMPMPEEYAEHIESEVADLKNTGRAGQAGSISAAMLLAEFVGGKPWAHLDIAGPARSTENSGYLTKGGTGFGVRTLLALLGSY